MSKLQKCYGIIPARYPSTRFPGKPLADILGKPMFWHVYDRATRSPELTRVVLATDDHRIREAAEELDVPVVMTREDHPSGTDRVLEAAELIGVDDNAIVVNIQGDEPTLHPEILTTLVRPFASSEIQVATLAKKISREESEQPSRVNVVLSESGKGMYFSRSLLPYHGGEEEADYYEHVGLFAFRMKMLRKFVALGPSPLERAEKLEMLRLIENDIPIQVEITEHTSMCVDYPEDLEIVKQFLLAGESRGS
jgi:3-deoxy-manno-octulosonate cytidylyltransferase (CMP-KDO synthetase)